MSEKKKKEPKEPKSLYKVKKLQIDKAKELGVQIRPSTNKKKKLDVFIKGKKQYSIGANGMNDYASYLQRKDISKEEAEAKRLNYIQRHSKEPKMDKDGEFTKSLYADELLWGKRKDNINTETKKKEKVIKQITKDIQTKEKEREKKLKMKK